VKLSETDTTSGARIFSGGSAFCNVIGEQLRLGGPVLHLETTAPGKGVSRELERQQ
jgi:hypothetical protein